MQKALLAASRTSLFGHFGGRHGGAAVYVKLQNTRSRVAYRVLATRAGEQAQQSGDNPKVDVDDEDEIATGSHSQTRKAYRDDMEESYGVAYATRASDMGYGERYGETVKAVLEKKADKMEMQRGASAERDQQADAFVDAEYDTTQGEPVAQKEHGRHATGADAFESEKKAHKSAEEMGGRGGSSA